jgi:tripartite-type tricarboxylate transporter receptor subunit TctC
MKFARREFLGVAAGAAALAGSARSAGAALYPERPIRLILPFPPGGVFDIIGRPWADKVKTSLGTVFVDNQPGAGGSLAAQLVAHAPADGYTIFLGGSTIHLTEMILREHPLLDPMKELTPVSMVAITCFAIVVNPAVPVHSLGELVAYVKANPGKMAFGSAGTGTLNHLSGELLKSLTGITDLPHVPYRGAGPAIADAIGGQIPIIIPAMTNQVLEFHRTGKLRLLAVTNPTRIAIAPDISTRSKPACRALSRSRCSGCSRRLERRSRSSPRSTTPIIAPWRTRPIANRWSMLQSFRCRIGRRRSSTRSWIRSWRAGRRSLRRSACGWIKRSG